MLSFGPGSGPAGQVFEEIFKSTFGIFEKFFPCFPVFFRSSSFISWLFLFILVLFFLSFLSLLLSWFYNRLTLCHAAFSSSGTWHVGDSLLRWQYYPYDRHGVQCCGPWEKSNFWMQPASHVAANNCDWWQLLCTFFFHVGTRGVLLDMSRGRLVVEHCDGWYVSVTQSARLPPAGMVPLLSQYHVTTSTIAIGCALWADFFPRMLLLVPL